MPNGEGTNADGSMAQDQVMAGEATPAPEPESLADAFAQLRQANNAAAQAGVEAAASLEPQAPAGAGSSAPAVDDMAEPMGGVGDEAAAAPVPDNSGDQDMGGGAANYSSVDYAPAKEQILNGIQQQARGNVLRRFNENGVRLWKIDDIYERNEETGYVTYRNPERPDEPFPSRKEARGFIDSINKDIRDRMQYEINQETIKLTRQAAPTLAMIDFAPTYQKLNDAEREVFDYLIAPYAVTNEAGQTIGFNVNLDAVAAQAAKIARSFGGGVQVAQDQAGQDSGKAAAPAAGGPAMDMRTGNGKAADEKEPKTIGEALAMLDKKNKGGK